MSASESPDALQGAGAAAPDENQIIAERRAKLTEIRRHGSAYPNDFVPTHDSRSLHTEHDAEDPDALAARAIEVKVAGRIMLKRLMGKASFATIQDTGGRIQLYVKIDEIGADRYALFKHWDLGDIVGASGTLFITRAGELSVKVTEIRLLSKALRPLPDKFHGIADQELRYRQRYVDLIVEERTRTTFIARSRAIASIRQYMTTHAFLEVETPMLHPIPGGAAARPFVTHHNALDMAMYLRIAPELYLKRLVVGGFERVFEINRNFRNEGTSPRHNPEFTMLEFYAAYTDYRWIMHFTEGLLRQAARDARGSARLTYQGRELDLESPFERLTIRAAILRHAPEYRDGQLDDLEFLKRELRRHHSAVDTPPLRDAGVGALQLALFEAVAEAKLWNPTFITDYPAEVSPLARASDKDPGMTERFELFMTGREMANGFSELNDPEDQAERFRKQSAAKEAGDEEAMYYDADYIRALEYGMPPTGGCGVGIDRVVMLLTDSPNIRDVILFPHMRRED
jgi:lysyl-tRNA synthetase class 2